MREVSGTAKPGSSVTRKVSRGPGKGDTVQFQAVKSGAHPGKLVARKVVKDVGTKNTQSTLAKGKTGKRPSGPQTPADRTVDFAARQNKSVGHG